MTVVQGPCYSIEARGTLADSITWAKVRHTSYTKAYFTPNNPQSDAQTATRYMRQWLIESWPGLSDEYKSSWSVLADRLRLSPFHAFLKINCQRWANNLLPTKTPQVSDTTEWTQATGYFTLNVDEYELRCKIIGEPVIPYACQFFVDTDPDFIPQKKFTLTLKSDWYWNLNGWRIVTYWTRPDTETYYLKWRYSSFNGATSRFLGIGFTPR